MNDFENRLKQVQPRRIPASWRHGILADASGQETGPAVLSWMHGLYPGHAYTGALAALWLLIVLFYADTPPLEQPKGAPIDMARVIEVKEECALIMARLEAPEFKVDVEKGEISMPVKDLNKKGS